AERPERLPNHDELCRQVEAYNREDCVSAQKLRDWLEDRRRDLETRLGVEVPRPKPEAPKTSDEATELKARTAAAKERLTSGIPADAGDRSPGQQGTWLLAQLLEWHAREDKSVWWDFFRMLHLNDQEIVEDPKALAASPTRVRSARSRSPRFTAIGSPSRSTTWRLATSARRAHRATRRVTPTKPAKRREASRSTRLTISAARSTSPWAREDRLPRSAPSFPR